MIVSFSSLLWARKHFNALYLVGNEAGNSTEAGWHRGWKEKHVDKFTIMATSWGWKWTSPLMLRK